MDKEFQQFGELIESSPNIAILNIDNGFEEITSFLENFIAKNNGELTYKKLEEIDVKRFRLKDRNFEYAVISDCLHQIENKEQFIKSIYHSLENSAFIILLERKEKSDLSMLIDLLDRCNFRAVNSIDIFKEYTLVMAKKLHMWGAGQ